MNLPTKQKLNHGHREEAGGCHGGGDWGRMGGVGTKRCKLLYIEWINKVLLHSTGNYIQYPVVSQMEKNFKKNMYGCVTESLCCEAEINTTLQINYNLIYINK